MIEALVVYVDFDNQLGFASKQLRFKSRSVYMRYTNRNSEVYRCGGFVRYNLSGLDSKRLRLEELVKL